MEASQGLAYTEDQLVHILDAFGFRHASRYSHSKRPS